MSTGRFSRRKDQARARGARCGAAAVIHRHFQTHGHAKLAVSHLVDAHDLCHIFAVHWIVGGELNGKVTKTRMPL